MIQPIPFTLDTFFREIQNPANPGAGNELTTTSPANCFAILSRLTFLFTSDANAGNRIVRVASRSLPAIFPLGNANAQQTASLAITYDFFIGATAQYPTNSLRQTCPLAYPYLYAGGENWYIFVDNIKAGDAITDIYAEWMIWPNSTPT